jgi:hypothetical protein
MKPGDKITWKHLVRSKHSSYEATHEGELVRMSKRGLWTVDVENSQYAECCDDKGIYCLVDKK